MRPLMKKEQVTEVIERRSDSAGVPLFLVKWWGGGLTEQYGDRAIHALEEWYEEDILGVFIEAPGEHISGTSNPEYRWGYRDYAGKAAHSIGQHHVLLEDWTDLDAYIEAMPDPMEAGAFDGVKRAVDRANGRYVLGCWWRFFHERFWSIRGMENLMYDYYDAMDELKMLGERIASFYRVWIDRMADAGVDGLGRVQSFL